MANKLRRVQVYQLIEGERAHQTKRYPAARTVGEYVAILQYYQNKLANAGIDNPAVLDIIREITAVGVAAMEEHGAPSRAT